MIDTFFSYLPSLHLLIMFCILNIVRFENQRWIRARQAGMRGRSILAGFCVDFIGFTSLIFYYLFLLSYGFENSVWSAILLFVIASITGMLANVITTIVFRGDNPLVWAVSTISILPLQFALFYEVNWLGLLW